MWPALRTGDVAQLGAAPSLIEIGAVVVARTDGALVAHRVRARTSTGALVLRGDTCTTDDAPVPLSQVLGVVQRVRRGDHVLAPGEWDASWCRILSAGMRARRRVSQWRRSR